ncbi:MAG: hypothetical protein JW993_04575 [Sedimentisphaerales bacterium]|nr:hypothetical protein [Sedimentisphaerales bacterium]
MRRESILALVLAALLGAMATADEAAEAPAGLLGDESDGSRAHPVHLIPLFAANEDGEKGEQVTPDADVVLPFSTRFTCAECHSYDLVKMGWHFNAMEPNVPIGRNGQPWIYFDQRLGVQVPLSYRPWPGTHLPSDLGLTPFRFTQLFGRHMPGGGPGEVKATAIDDIGRQLVSGPLEINCLACHNGHYGQDMGGTAGYSVQVSRLNYRWAAAASSEVAAGKGSALEMSPMYDPFMPEGGENEPRVIYREDAFDADGQVLFDIRREVPNQRCYYCHSNVYYSDEESETEKWSTDEDVHLKAGLTCVDCHRNDVEHHIVRGYPNESAVSENQLAATTTCESCHLPEDSLEALPEAGRLGAPVPQHIGLPPVHFETLTCTACHAGPWPGEAAVLTKTSRAHRLGTPNVNKAEQVLPHIFSPVFARQRVAQTLNEDVSTAAEEEKIAPHKVIWPAYWGTLAGDKVTPLELSVIEKAIGSVFADLEMPANASWPGVSEAQLTQALKALSVVDSNAVYVAGGSLYRLADANDVIKVPDHPAAKAYLWPLAHNVRPATQSLGVRYCTDCHSAKSPFFFGAVAIDSPLAAETPVTKEMVSFQDISRFHAWAFSASFVFRPWFKVVALGSAGILAVVLLLYGLKALGAVARTLAEDE